MSEGVRGVRQTDGGAVFASMGKDDVFIPAEGDKPAQFRRKVIRRIEVPFTRKVKVPVVTSQVVDTVVQKRIATKKYVQVIDVRDVEEEYTVLEKVKKTRDVEKWVEEEVEEEYTKKVPKKVKKTVKKPVKRIVEQEVETEVEVPGTKVVTVKGFRIDEIEAERIVEVDEYEVFEMMPHSTGKFIKGKSRVLGRVDGRQGTVTTVVGQKVYTGDETKELKSLPVSESGVQMSNNDYSVFMTHSGFTHAKGTVKKGVVSDEGKETSAFAPEEGFNLEKCLAYTGEWMAKNLNLPGETDMSKFIDEIRTRWVFVDKDESGSCSYQELRQAVWDAEEMNEGVPMPEGQFEPQLQDVVDEIYNGTGRKQEFSFWDHVNFYLREELSVDQTVDIPDPTWAHVKGLY